MVAPAAKMSIAAAISSCWLVLFFAAHVQAQTLHTAGGFFRDAQGAVVVLRGLNVAGDAKVPPFQPIDDARLFDDFPRWGVNVVRLLFTWEAFEPTRGTYNDSYFDYYLGVVDALHARGVRVIVDVHQDAYARFVMDGCGEGFPEWAVSPNVTKKVPDNGPNCSSWGIKLVLDKDMHRAWDDFYADVDGVRTRYLALLDTLATRLGSHPAVIGYDMLNEPWADELTQLAPLHEDGARVLRAKDPDALLFLSPQALTSSGQDTKLPPPSFHGFAYAPHYYDASVVEAHAWPGGTLSDPVERMAKQAQSWQVPLLIGEFGAPADTTDVADYMDAFYHELDARFASATQWSFVAHWTNELKDGWNTEDFSIVDAQGAPRMNYRVRPYAARISGEPGSFEVDDTVALTVTLAWKHVPAQGATRMFAPRALFKGDVAAETVGKLDCNYEDDWLHVRCTSAHAGDKRLVLRACKAGEACLQVLEAAVDKPSTAQGDGGSGAGCTVGPVSRHTRSGIVPGLLLAWFACTRRHRRAKCAR
jgi:endoglycosylceramidase